MVIKRIAKKGMAIVLATALVMATGTPVSAYANETSDAVTEVSVADALVKEKQEAETGDTEMKNSVQDEEGMTADQADESVDLNEIVTVENYVIDLHGASVVVVADSTNAVKSQIFPDYNRDKVPDNQIPLKIGNSDSHRLASYELRGYSDSSKPFEGDISITLTGGNIKNVYGVYGTENAPVTVNGNVTLNLEGVNASSGKAMASYYGKAENVSFSYTNSFTQTTINSKVEMYAAYKSEIDGDVNFIFGKQAKLQGEGESTASRGRIGVATGSTIGGDVKAKMGFETEDGFMSWNTKYYYTDFLGITDTKVLGSVDYDLDGIWNPATTVLVKNSTIEKDVNMKVVSSNFTARQGSNEATMVEDSAINGNLKFVSDAQTGLTSRGSIVLLRGTGAEKKTTLQGDLYVDLPVQNIKNGWTGIGANAEVEGSVYSNVAGSVTIDTAGTSVYTISKDMDGKELIICEDANVVIDKNVRVELSRDLDLQTGAKLENKGTLSLKLANRSDEDGSVGGLFVNEGSFDVKYSSDETKGRLIIDDSGLIINEKDAVWNVGCYIDNQGKIVNYGSFVQTYSHMSGEDYYYARLGKIFTTQPLTLSRQINAAMYTASSEGAYNSKMYYAIDVKYPTHCANAPTLTGTEIISSGISGDENKYIRMARIGEGITSDFTLTPGTIKMQDCVLEEVTYGSAKKTIEPTQVAGGDVYTASVLGEFSPITITLDYGEAAEITPISLDKTSDSVSGLRVDRTYTKEAPLYDLGSLTVIGDIDSEEGSVVYTHKEGQLPKGIGFQDGKLYGTCKEACGAETVLTFTVTGRNLTTAEFTLTLGAVEKAGMNWRIPTGFTANVGQAVSDVPLPSDSRGEYEWENEGKTFECVGTAVANIIFTPYSSYSPKNYDWANAAGDAWDAENGRICCQVQITVAAGEPSVTAPTGLTAVYGQKFADVVLPSDENGTFTWDTSRHALDALVGTVGEHTCYVTYTPMDENHTPKSGIEVKLIVKPATPGYEETLSEVEMLCDVSLGEILLPETDGGSYQWISESTIKPEDGETYTVVYLPKDTANYDWSTVAGWDTERQGVVFEVKIKISHAWDEGVVTLEPTKEAEGEKVYTCGLCGEKQMQILEKLPQTPGDGEDVSGSDDNTESGETPGGSSGENAGNGADNSTGSEAGSDVAGSGNTGNADNEQKPESPTVPQEGYTLSDKNSKAVYKVSVAGKEVTYVKPLKKTYTKVKIPNTIKYDGVTYKVTVIAGGAFKNNKKLKSVTIPTNIKEIGKSAFENCFALKSVTIPKNVKKIGSKAFYNCKKLIKMTIKTTGLTEKSVGKKAFGKMGSSNYKKVNVKVPKKKLTSYKKMLYKRGLSKKAKVKK